MSIPVARALLDTANGLLMTGVNSVVVNDQPIAVKTTTVDAGGFDVIVASGNVFAGSDQTGVAREGDPMSNGVLIASGSSDVKAN